MSELIYGNIVSQNIREELLTKVNALEQALTLVVIIVGDDAASHVYVNSKEKAATSCNILSKIDRLSNDTTQDELLEIIHRYNKDDSIDGILVQFPLPKHIDQNTIINAIDPLKDVDGLHPINVGKLHLNQEALIPCTAYGIIKLLDSINYSYKGKNAVVIGRSNLVGLPIAKLLEQRNCTTTICHSHTTNLQELCLSADLLIVAIGKPLFIDRNYVKDNSTIIDVGINRIDGKIVGDVNLEDIIDKVEYITPVPKGVGPMTITMLMENTYKAHLLRGKK